MVAIKAHEADRALARPDPAWRLFLFYGPDTGLVQERSARLAQVSVSDPADPFQLVRMDGDELGSDPMRLVDEANTIGLFGGSRAIRVTATSRSLVSAAELLIATPPVDAIVIIEAGDLQRANPLRLAVEKARSALAVPCYGDAGRDLGAIVDEATRSSGKRITREARETLLGLLGNDRLVSRGEIEKLLLYVGNDPEITTDHVAAVIGDSASRELDTLVDAVFSGQIGALDLALVKISAEGLDAGVLLGGVLRYVLGLTRARLALDSGKAARESIGQMRLPYPRMAVAETALRNWSLVRLTEATAQLGAAMAATRRESDLGRALAARTLWTLARMTPKARP